MTINLTPRKCLACRSPVEAFLSEPWHGRRNQVCLMTPLTLRHGGQQLRLFNAHYDDYGFQPIVVFDGAGRFVAAVLRPARRPKGREIAAHLRRLIRAMREHWPRVEILLRGDGHYCAPEVLDLCRAQGVDFILGLPTTSVLRRHVAALEASTTARAAATEGPPSAGSRSSTTPPHPGAASSASSPASRQAHAAAIPASSSPA